jgi:hypothetical protein
MAYRLSFRRPAIAGGGWKSKTPADGAGGGQNLGVLRPRYGASIPIISTTTTAEMAADEQHRDIATLDMGTD